MKKKEIVKNYTKTITTCVKKMEDLLNCSHNNMANGYWDMMMDKLFDIESNAKSFEKYFALHDDEANEEVEPF